ncbi:MAG: Rne/Rng family ribonuclease [Rhodospirillales bacterium]|nr:Rne/Rng family ribonuclease [Rhodospirillales bacterium]
MIDEIICSRFDGGMDVALREAGQVIQMVVVSDGGNDHVGNVVLGRVTGILKGMEACFVDLGTDKSGFLSMSQRSHNDDANSERNAAIHEGAEVLVQVTKAPQAGKGAGLTRNIGLPGRFLVFTPFQPRIAVSKRITDDDTRAKLEQTVSDFRGDEANGGFIVRTVAEDADVDALKADAENLRSPWAGIQQAKVGATPPLLLYGEGVGLSEVLRDHGHENLRRVVVDDGGMENEAKAFFETYLSGAATKIELWGEEDPLFEALGIEDEIDAALSTEVSLPCGGSMLIEETQALTAIDINSGRNTGRNDGAGGHAQTIFETNMEAAHDLPRQLRLRNQGGMVVIDFIHMDNDDHCEKVLECLMEGLKRDPAFIEATGFSALGLVELSRRRGAGPLREQLDRVED